MPLSLFLGVTIFHPFQQHYLDSPLSLLLLLLLLLFFFFSKKSFIFRLSVLEVSLSLQVTDSSLCLLLASATNALCRCMAQTSLYIKPIVISLTHIDQVTEMTCSYGCQTTHYIQLSFTNHPTLIWFFSWKLTNIPNPAFIFWHIHCTCLSSTHSEC